MTFEKMIKYIDFNLGLLSKNIKKWCTPSQWMDKVLDNIWCGQDAVYECENKDDLFNWLQTLNTTLKPYMVNCKIVNVRNFYNELVFDILDYITNDR